MYFFVLTNMSKRIQNFLNVLCFQKCKVYDGNEPCFYTETPHAVFKASAVFPIGNNSSVLTCPHKEFTVCYTLPLLKSTPAEL